MARSSDRALNKQLNIQRRLAWSLSKNNTHNRREATPFKRMMSKSPATHNKEDKILALSPESVQAKHIAPTTEIVLFPIINPSPAGSTVSKCTPITTDVDEITTDDKSPKDSTLMSAAILFKGISIYVDILFFVCYTPAEMLRPRSYLIQVNLAESQK